MKIKLFADGANLTDMVALYQGNVVSGFTTNPTLMRRAGVTNYEAFGHAVVAAVPDLPVSFEVFADDPPGMLREARTIASWGSNVYVKVPIVNTRGDSTHDVIATLLSEGIAVNVTAICNVDAIAPLLPLFGIRPVIVLVFAGRIADTGRDACYHMFLARQMLASKPNTQLLWASARQVYSIMEAEAAQCHIITVTPDILRKLSGLHRDLRDLTLSTVQQFHNDATASHYSIGGSHE
jgi:transaldolase